MTAAGWLGSGMPVYSEIGRTQVEVLYSSGRFTSCEMFEGSQPIALASSVWRPRF